MERTKEILREGLILEQRIKFDIPLPSDIEDFKDVFKKNGFKLYLVGGAVRDSLLKIKPKDFDLTTDAVPDKVEEMMSNAGFRTLPTGKAFGVINVFTDTGEYEIATFRGETGYSDGRRPDSVVFSDIETDVKRRDITFNALFYDIDTKEIVDLVGGLEDLKNGVVRTVGSPEDRFGEDKLRIMRTIRFAARLGSKLDQEIQTALEKGVNLDNISGERIRDEFIKGVRTAKSQKEFFRMLDKYGLFRWIFKDLNVDRGAFSDGDDYIVLLSRLLKNNNIDVIRKKLNELKYSVEEVKSISFLVALLKLDIETAVLLKKAEQNAGVTKEQIKSFASEEGLETKLINAFINFRLSVSGQEVMDEMGLKPGPEVGKAVQKIETENFKNLLKNY